MGKFNKVLKMKKFDKVLHLCVEMSSIMKWLNVLFIIGILGSITQTTFCADIIVDSYTKATLPAPGTAGRLTRVTDDKSGLVMDNGSSWAFQYPVAVAENFTGADAGARIRAAIQSLPSTGGTVDARGFEGIQTISSNPFFGITKPIRLLLGHADYRTSVEIDILDANGSIEIIGVGASFYLGGGTVIRPANGSSPGTLIRYRETADTNKTTSFRLENIALTGVRPDSTIATTSGVEVQTINLWKKVVLQDLILKNFPSGYLLVSNGVWHSRFQNIEMIQSEGIPETPYFIRLTRVGGSLLGHPRYNVFQNIHINGAGTISGNLAVTGIDIVEGTFNQFYDVAISDLTFSNAAIDIGAVTGSVSESNYFDNLKFSGNAASVGYTGPGLIRVKGRGNYIQNGTLAALASLAVTFDGTNAIENTVVNSYLFSAATFREINGAANNRVWGISTRDQTIYGLTGLDNAALWLQNNRYIVGRNAANTANLPLIRLDNGNNVELGQPGMNVVLANSSLVVGGSGTTYGPNQAVIVTGGTGITPLVVRGAVGQSADLLRAENSGQTSLFAVQPGGVSIGAGAAITKHLSATTTWDPPSISNGTATSTTITVTDAAVGDTVAVGFSTPVPGKALLVGAVTATNTVTVTLLNHTGASLNLASGTLRTDVWKH